MAKYYTVLPKKELFPYEVGGRAEARHEAHVKAAIYAATDKLPHSVHNALGRCGFTVESLFEPTSTLSKIRELGLAAYWCFNTWQWKPLDEDEEESDIKESLYITS